MKSNDYLVSIAMEAAQEASTIALAAFRSTNRSAREKADKSFITETDIAVESVIVEVLAKYTPDFGIYAEEETSGKRTRKEYTWIIDPIDGTHNFHYGFPVFAVQIALEHKGDIVAAVTSLPNEDVLLHAVRDGGCFANRERVRVSSRPLKRGLLLLETHWTDTDLEILNIFRTVPHDIRVISSSCASTAYIALGRADALIDWDDKPWDLAAGSLLVQEAGGIVTNIHGGKFDVYRPTCVATNGIDHQEIISLLRSAAVFAKHPRLSESAGV